jgi:hypothetical protein
MLLITFRADALDLRFVVVDNCIEIRAVSYIIGKQLFFISALVRLIERHFSISAFCFFVVN